MAPFGIGALVDFRGDESLMTAGLDEWPFAEEQCPSDWLVKEERLQARLGVTHFRLPPDYRESGPNIQHPNQWIPFVRFPLWHYCPRRGAMEKLSLFGGQSRCPCRPGLDCESVPDVKRPRLIPSRFIAVCPKGHIEDFPFMEWVHRDGVWDEKCKLRLLPGRSSASLTGIKIQCSCGKAESMSGSFNFDEGEGGTLHKIGYDCSGATPWLGSEGKRSYCGEYLRVVQRGASNVYFPRTVSSIHLPLWGKELGRTINKMLEDPRIWDMLTAGIDDGRYIQSSRCEIVAPIYSVDAEELRKAAQRKLDETTDLESAVIRSEEEFRRQEYNALRSGEGGDTTDLKVDVRDIGEYASELTNFLSKICLVKKLRETRVLVGFSRLLPVEDTSAIELLPMSETDELSWLPATVVHGEGIFLEFDPHRLNTWLQNPKVKGRISSMNDSFNQDRVNRGLKEQTITPKYTLLHTFAHAMIAQLSFDCGYGSAALRERIYCESEDPSNPMQGILIYTASGDSEGTLGGLVRQGEPSHLWTLVKRAISQARWCSSDPVCIESIGQGVDNANLSACHGCVLLPETSCETGNRLLDRGVLVGTSQEPNLGFFSLLL